MLSFAKSDDSFEEEKDQITCSTTGFRSMKKPSIGSARKKTYAISESSQSELKMANLKLKFATINIFSTRL